MNNWWSEFERTASLNLEDNDKARLEELTGCNPILLRPLLSSSVADSQGNDNPEVVEYLFKLVLSSTEARDVKENIERFVSSRRRHCVQDPVGWQL